MGECSRGVTNSMIGFELIGAGLIPAGSAKEKEWKIKL